MTNLGLNPFLPEVSNPAQYVSTSERSINSSRALKTIIACQPSGRPNAGLIHLTLGKLAEIRRRPSPLV
jgi:hypothetical protein